MKIICDWSEPQTPLSFFTDSILKSSDFSEYQYQPMTGALSPQRLKDEDAYFHKWPLHKSREALALFASRPEKVQLLEVLDCLVTKVGPENETQYWPELFLPAVIRKVIKNKVSTLNLNHYAYIVAQDLWIRPLAAAAVNLGFANIKLVGTDGEFLKSQKSYLSRKLIGVQFEIVMTQELTLQPQQAGLLMNSLDLNKSKESLQDLAYFNFMVPEGLFLDFIDGAPNLSLREEADRAHLISLSALEIEQFWWNHALLGK